MFLRTDIYKGTWKAPNGRYTNQIDHVLINTKFKNCLHDVKIVREADCDLDHYVVKGELKVKLKKPRVKKGLILDRYEINKLRDNIVCESFKRQLYETISNLDINKVDTIDCKWKTIKETIKVVVSDTMIGKQKKMKKPWFNSSCEEALNRRKETRLQWINDPSNLEKEITYKECQKETNNIYRFKKRKYTKDILQDAETNHRDNKSRELYHNIIIQLRVDTKNMKDS